jgi:ribosomal protein S18 acetylase RimI-like enzyme
MSGSTVSIRDIPAELTDEVARIHQSALPSDIAALLGGQFLTRVFYPALIGSSDTALGAFKGDNLVGFIVFSSDDSFYPRLVRKNFMKLALAGLSRSISPAFWRNAFSVARYMLSAGKPPDGSELAYIAVRPDFHGQGIGTQLVETGFERLRAAGITDCWVKTLESTPENVRFYERLGFEFHSSNRGRVILAVDINR